MHKQRSKQKSPIRLTKTAAKNKTQLKKQPKRKITTSSRRSAPSTGFSVTTTSMPTSFDQAAITPLTTQFSFLHTTPLKTPLQALTVPVSAPLPSLQQHYKTIKLQRDRNASFKTTLRLLSQPTPTPNQTITPESKQAATPVSTPEPVATTPSTVDSTTPQASTAEGTPEKKESKFKQMYKKYGKLTVYTYLGVYVSTLALITVGVNLVPGFDAQVPIQMVKDGHHFDRQFEFLERTLQEFPRLQQFLNTYPKQTANFGAAWCLTKLTEPVRLLVTGGLVPLIHRRRTKQTTEIAEAVQQDKAV